MCNASFKCAKERLNEETRSFGFHSFVTFAYDAKAKKVVEECFIKYKMVRGTLSFAY